MIGQNNACGESRDQDWKLFERYIGREHMVHGIWKWELPSEKTCDVVLEEGLKGSVCRRRKGG